MTCSSNLNNVEKFKKRRKCMKYNKTLSKNTKIGNQALTIVPLAKKKTQPKNKKKELLLCRDPSYTGALGIGTCAEGGPSAKRCTLPTAPASSRQRPVNHGQRLCRELGRGSRHRLRLCLRPNGRAVDTVDGSPNVTVLAPSLTVPSLSSAAPRQRLDYAEGPILLTARPSAKVTMP
jgi:hypothetical protein